MKQTRETMNNTTELVFILDRSGSMSGLESDTIGGFNSMISDQKKQDGMAYVTTVLFDHEIDKLHDRIPLKDVPKMTDRDYTVRGCTALLDAIGDTIKHIGNIHKYARPEDVPAHTMFVITTDGMENASKRYNSKEIKALDRAPKEALRLGVCIYRREHRRGGDRTQLRNQRAQRGQLPCRHNRHTGGVRGGQQRGRKYPLRSSYGTPMA